MAGAENGRDRVAAGLSTLQLDDPEPRIPSTSGLLLVVALTTGVVAQGAYYPSGQQVTAVLLVAAVVAGLRAHPGLAADFRLAPVQAAGVLAAWAITSAVSSGHPAAAGSTVVMLSGVVGVILVCRRMTWAQCDSIVGAVVVVGVLVAATGWIGVTWRVTPWALEDDGLWRAATVLTYANATAGLLVPLVLLAISRPSPTPRSPVPVVCTCLLLVGVGASLSRAGIFALLVGVAVLALLLGARRVLSAMAAPAVGAAIALLGLAPSMPIGQPARPAMANLALAVGLAVAVGLARVRQPGTALAIPCVAVIALLALVQPALMVRTLSAIGSPRVSLASPDRSNEVRAALRVAAHRPIAGVGPGQAVLVWVAADGDVKRARYAHNEYLQVAAEMGVVGLGLLVALLALLGRAVWRSRPLTPAPGLWAGSVAGLTALALHSAFDFLWHIPVIPLVGGLLVGIHLHQRTEISHEF